MATKSKAYQSKASDQICQGDIFKNVKYNYIDYEDGESVNIVEYEFPLALIISQACDVIAMEELIVKKSGNSDSHHEVFSRAWRKDSRDPEDMDSKEVLLMNKYSDICYKNSFLSQVIVRVDYAQFIPTNSLFDISVETEILKIFPRRGKDQIVRFNSINVVIDQKNNGIPNANGEVIEGIQREYLTNANRNRLILSNKCIVFEINNYDRFEVHRNWFQSILLAFFQKNRISATRTGIRYINIFDTSKIRLQKNFFSSEIAPFLLVRPINENTRSHLIRSMHMAEYRVDEMTLNFRYGMYNPEYPNILRKNDFALDLDFFSNEAIDSADKILQVLDKGHSEIQYLFEESITDSLREVMNNEQLS